MAPNLCQSIGCCEFTVHHSSFAKLFFVVSFSIKYRINNKVEL